MTTSTILRQVEMLRYIPKEPDSKSTKDIYIHLTSEGFVVTKRTVERDLLRVSEPLGLDYKTETDGNYWYYIKSGKQILPSQSPHEALLLMQAKAFLSPMLPTNSLLTLEPRFEKAESTLKNNRKHRNWQQKISIAKNVHLEQEFISDNFREVVYDAVLNETQLNISFKRNSGEVVTTTVNPYGLIIKDHMQYLVNSRACSPNELKLIKLPNIIAVESTLKNNQLCTDNVKQFIQSNAASYKLLDKPINVQMKVAGPALLLLQSSKLSQDQIITPFEGHNNKSCGILSATTELTHDFVHFLLGYGKWVEVLEPQPLIDAINDRKSGDVF